MRWFVSVSLIGLLCLGGAMAFAPRDSSADSVRETHCAMELVAGDGSSNGPEICFDTEAELNEVAGLTNPGDLPSSGGPE